MKYPAVDVTNVTVKTTQREISLTKQQVLAILTAWAVNEYNFTDPHVSFQEGFDCSFQGAHVSEDIVEHKSAKKEIIT